MSNNINESKKFNKREFDKKLSQLTDEDRYDEILEMFSSIPEEKWTLEIRVDFARTYNNIGMIEHEKGDPERVKYLNKAISLLEELRNEGMNDRYWNERMGMAYYSMGHSVENSQSLEWYMKALPHFKKYRELSNTKKRIKEADFFISECKENIVNMALDKKEYKLAFSMLDTIPYAHEKYSEIGVHGLSGYPNIFDSGKYEYVHPSVPNEVKTIIKEKTRKAEALALKECYEDAIHLIFDAILLIPEPKNAHIEAVLLEIKAGEIFIALEKYLEASILFFNAFQNASKEGYNDFVLINLSYCFYKLSDTKESTKYIQHLAKISKEINTKLLLNKDKEFTELLTSLISKMNTEKNSKENKSH